MDLGTADSMGSIVGASAGVLSLGASIVQLVRERRIDTDAPTRRRRSAGRRGAATAVVASVLLGASAVLVLHREPADSAVAFAAIGLFVASLGLAAVRILHHLRQPAVLDSAARRLLERQSSQSLRPRHGFGSMNPPPVTQLYVEQRGERTHLPRRSSQRLDNPVLTAAEMLRSEGHIVLVAGPGGGKSMFANNVVSQSCTWWLDARRGTLRRRSPFGPFVAIMIPASAMIGMSVLDAFDAYARRLGAGSIAEALAGPPAHKARWFLVVRRTG